METMQTNVGRRKDLESLPCNFPAEYIGTKLFPIANTSEKSGTFTYRAVVADSAAEVSRPAGQVLAKVQLTNASGSFACLSYEKRHSATEADVREVNGLAAMDVIGARASKRTVMRAFEDAVYAKTFTTARKNAAITLAASHEIEQINVAMMSVKRVVGDISLVCSQSWLLAFIGLSAVQSRIAAVNGLQGFFSLRDMVMSMQTDLVASMLRTLFPFRNVLVGDDDHFFGGNAGSPYAMVMSIPKPVSGAEILIQSKSEPVYGLSKWFLPEGNTAEAPFEIKAQWDVGDNSNVYDATGWFDLVELNAAGARCVQLPAGAVQTTTTTTTTSTTTTTTTTAG
jgi:hypothetical protein